MHSTGDDAGGPRPLGSEEDLLWRLSQVTPEDTTRGIFLNAVLESVQQLGGEAAVQHCLAESEEKRFLDLFNYPISTLLRMSYAGARLLSNETRSFDEVMRQMGYVSARSFASSRMGALILRTIFSEPRRLLDILPSTHRISTSAGECKVRWTGHTSAVVLIRRNFLPHSYMEGSLQGAFEAARVRGLTVRTRPAALLDAEYELSWG
ncbi:TIGR02265 family protein [Archangium sp.]|uniref:TIGR02265 family protein n=1 Tax=Archangium sp. TaxID=1872627 RepID=UPI002D3C6B99|nr:TIGR02265 family protein [Archangium sp.]HYO57864.1 TIGR02265 family protein [Archangium sp.]